MSKNQYEGGVQNWPLNLFTELVPELKVFPFTEDVGEKIAGRTIRSAPDVSFAYYTASYDLVQTAFYLLGGGD